MSTESDRAAEVSRRNGSLSKGPRSEVGKANSAGNARKHDLFASKPGQPPGQMSGVARIAALFEDHDPANVWHGIDTSISLEAAIRLEQATALVETWRIRISEYFEEDGGAEDLSALLEQWRRYRRYERRFRGRRDKALRTYASRARTMARERLNERDPVHGQG
ncbi:MAG: hypothetical protein EOP84_05540 [Verrucomicrobiaceae bacterium]|nr:MAG: hypothetical protein EOP84_05540 [Verrucomicrobiaceae bacterium]